MARGELKGEGFQPENAHDTAAAFCAEARSPSGSTVRLVVRDRTALANTRCSRPALPVFVIPPIAGSVGTNGNHTGSTQSHRSGRTANQAVQATSAGEMLSRRVWSRAFGESEDPEDVE